MARLLLFLRQFGEQNFLLLRYGYSKWQTGHTDWARDHAGERVWIVMDYS